MKLKNKKTGEIGYTAVLQSKAIIVMDENAIQLGSYTSLAELNEEWEDAPEEPKSAIKDIWFNNKIANAHFVGIDFINDEEAEKAVEKLKAVKRLKDKGFEAFSSSICGDNFVVNFKLTNHVDYSQSMDDFNSIFDFGGECE